MNYHGTRLAGALACLGLLTSFVGACGDDDKPDGGPPPADGGNAGMDASRPDAGAGFDAGGSKPDGAIPGGGDAAVTPATDAGAADAGTGPVDAGAADAGPPPCDPSAAPSIPALKTALVPGVGTLSTLVFAAQPPGSSDWYLVQQTGQIRILSGGTLRPAPFLDLSASIVVANDDERGLLGLAFPADHATSGKFYVMLTPTDGKPDANADIVLEYKRSAADPNVADLASKKEILKLEASAGNHNGGNILFGKDGFLYVGTGDGGGGCGSSKPGAPQDVGSPFGKILRLDPGTGTAPLYAAPGNPFAVGGDARVYHYGLRNPYRFGFDRTTGDLYIGDVGQVDYEEVDFASAGSSALNFGWPKFEGIHPDTCGTGNPLRAGSTHTKPIVDIPRTGTNAPPPFGDYKSVIGGRVYRGSALPSLAGVYLFGDYVGARFGALRQCGATTSAVTPILKNKDANSPSLPQISAGAGAPALGQLTAIVEDNAGELYLLANRNTLLKLVPGP